MGGGWVFDGHKYLHTYDCLLAAPHTSISFLQQPLQALGDDAGANEEVESWLDAKDLGKYASSIMEATDAETMDDLMLIDAALAEDVIKTAGLKLVTARKFRESSKNHWFLKQICTCCYDSR